MYIAVGNKPEKQEKYIIWPAAIADRYLVASPIEALHTNP